MSEQQEIKSYSNQGLVENVKKLYLKRKSYDVHFSFGSNDGSAKRVGAHKGMLAATSDVFDAMFYGDLKETGDIPITDSSETAFMEFLQFFYLDQVKLTMENIAGVMDLGHKYQVKDCIHACIQFLKDNLTPANVSIGLELGILYDHHGLLKFCEKIIVVETAAVLSSDAFLNCSKAALDHILKMNVFSCSEVEVFKACMTWVKAKSGQSVLTKEIVETHLGELFYKIRFASMSMSQLCTLQKTYPTVFSSDDFLTITNIISTPGFQPDKFNKIIRRADWNPVAVIKCDRTSSKEERKLMDLYASESTVFSTNKPLLLGSFTCEKIAIATGAKFSEMKRDWPVDVKITELYHGSKISKKRFF